MLIVVLASGGFLTFGLTLGVINAVGRRRARLAKEENA